MAIRQDLGPPARCVPPTLPPDLDSPYDVYDQLLVNALIYLAVRSGTQPLFVQANAFSLAAWNAIAPYDTQARPILETGIPRRPRSQHTQLHRSRAVAAALLRLQELVDPPLAAVLRKLMAASTPAGAFLLSPNYSRSGVRKYHTPESVPMWRCEDPAVYKAEVDEFLAASADLNDTTKAVTELMGGVPWWTLAIQQLGAPRNRSTTDLLAFNLVQVLQCCSDALNIVLKEKYVHDSVRPISAVQWLYGNTNVTAYGGPGLGTVTLPARDWLPYLQTSPEPEYPSGTACYCRVFTEWLQLWQGGAEAIAPPIIFGWPKGCSLREPEVSPAADTYFPLLSMAQFRQVCQDARVIGGVHFRAGVKAGNELCAGLAGGVWGKVQALYPKLAQADTR